MNINFAFFGSSRFSTIVLDELAQAGLIPTLIITTPDKPKGRKLILTGTPVKEWALKRNITVFDPQKLDKSFSEKLKAVINDNKIELFVVASYGKIIPEAVIALPLHKTLNIHPSLLPKYRGASPLQYAMLDDNKNTGITIISIDKEMDHGPIVAQEKVTVSEWPTYEEFEELMAKKGAELLARIMPDWIHGKIQEEAQNHDEASFTKKISKEDGLLDLVGNPYLNFRKIQAFHEWPQAYFLHEHGGRMIRVKITAATWEKDKLIIEHVIPEGSKEMPYADFLKGY